METAAIEYRLVPDYPCYRVGSDGSLWSQHLRGSKGKKLLANWRRCRDRIDPSTGYVRNSLHWQGKSREVRRHRLILEVFVSPCPPGMEGRHLNDDKLDNRLANLAWGTRRENVWDCKRNGHSPTGERRACAKLNRLSVQEIREKYLSGDSYGRLARDYGVAMETVGQIIRGETWNDDGRWSRPAQINSRRGTNHPMAKLNPDLAQHIRQLYALGGITMLALAKQFDVSESTIGRIIAKEVW